MICTAADISSRWIEPIGDLCIEVDIYMILFLLTPFYLSRAEILNFHTSLPSVSQGVAIFSNYKPYLSDWVV